MDLVFHYYVVKLLCLGVGIPEGEAEIIAHSSNHVDENTDWFKVDKGYPTEFDTVASFSIDVVKGADKTHPTLLTHFPPGDGPDKGTTRRDGQWFPGITTPGAEMARDSVEAAMAVRDPYAIGAALHTYADTWAHQGFAGCTHDVNELPDPVGIAGILPNTGHADAMHQPDWPVIWKDGRYQDGSCMINNRDRFRAAAEAIAEMLYDYQNPVEEGGSADHREKREAKVQEIVDEIFKAWGNPIPVAERKDKEIEALEREQIERLCDLGMQSRFGGVQLMAYDIERYHRNDIEKDVRGLDDAKVRKRTKGILSGDLLKDRYYWNRTRSARVAWKDHRKHRKDAFSSPFEVATLYNGSSKKHKGERFFATFPAVGADTSGDLSIARSVRGTGFYQFQQGVQTHMGYLVDQTMARTWDSGDDGVVSLYDAYDDGKTSPWVTDMLTRTADRRASIHGAYHEAKAALFEDDGDS